MRKDTDHVHTHHCEDDSRHDDHTILFHPRTHGLIHLQIVKMEHFSRLQRRCCINGAYHSSFFRITCFSSRRFVWELSSSHTKCSPNTQWVITSQYPKHLIWSDIYQGSLWLMNAMWIPMSSSSMEWLNDWYVHSPEVVPRCIKS